MLPLEQEKEYDFLNRRIIETFMEMSLLWLEPKWKKNSFLFEEAISLYIIVT